MRSIVHTSCQAEPAGHATVTDSDTANALNNSVFRSNGVGRRSGGCVATGHSYHPWGPARGAGRVGH
ncbi:hypothetical protein GCM10009558_100240 [Virgisporangium aurantiacum]